MNKLRVLLVAAALLMAACGTATISGSSVKSVSNSGNVRVDAGANAGANVTAGSEDDLSRPNPTIRKSGPIPVQQSAQPATPSTPSSTSGSDRCSAGAGAGSLGPRAGGAGPHPPLPMCPVD
jgi:hypothetical protein